ncbi:MAG TPA: hypothetical protein DGG95_10485 [Cytophagales bacterium]|jgi:uncharacterized protein YqcC (DUF446 family)|nr:hypothetical protein [Cytophagales bacterium]
MTKHEVVLAKANEIKIELKRLQRWDDNPMPEEKFEQMGAFGQGAMSFEQWIQFVLIDTIKEIVTHQGDFPSESNVGAYAVREFDGDPAASKLIQLLLELDSLINVDTVYEESLPNSNEYRGEPILGGHVSQLPIPPVAYQLAEVLPSFEGDALEAQLQTFDMFVVNTTEQGKEIIAKLLFEAAEKTVGEKERLRIKKAALSIQNGAPAAAPYNHEEAMKKYQQEFKKNYPNLDDSNLTQG